MSDNPTLQSGTKKRKDWIDALRALAMFFVILGHLIPGKTPYFVFTSPIKIPLFFMITGYVFNYNRTSTAGFFKNLFFKLIIPWLCLTVPFVFLTKPSNWASAVPTGLLNIVTGVVTWYLPCCIIAEVIWFFTCKLLKKPLFICLAACCISAAGFVLGYFGILDYATLNTAMIAQLYILFGYLYKTFEQKIIGLSWLIILALTAVYIGLGVVSLAAFPDTYLDIHNNYYYCYPLTLAMIMIGCFVIFTAADKLSRNGSFRIPQLICFLGQTTIVYYLLHLRNNTLLNAILKFLSFHPSGALLVCIRLIFIYVMCGIEAWIIIRFFPFILGRKRQPSKKKAHNDTASK